jgi:hypothetical protein
MVWLKPSARGVLAPVRLVKHRILISLWTLVLVVLIGSCEVRRRRFTPRIEDLANFDISPERNIVAEDVKCRISMQVSLSLDLRPAKRLLDQIGKA